jgi:hypothetical protein
LVYGATFLFESKKTARKFWRRENQKGFAFVPVFQHWQKATAEFDFGNNVYVVRNDSRRGKIIEKYIMGEKVNSLRY